jgi:diguanylate cyclase (GGDEF)-like protein/PAS domain S-box-containing protein
VGNGRKKSHSQRHLNASATLADGVGPETADVAPAAVEDRLVVLTVLPGVAETDLVRTQLPLALETVVLKSTLSLAGAVDRVAAGGIDIVLLGLDLPDSSGLPTFQRLHDCNPDVPIVVMVDEDGEDVALRAIAQGAQDYLTRQEIAPATLRRSVVASAERQRVLRRIRRDTERYTLAIDGTSDGLWDWDLDSDAVFYSARWNGLMGLPERDVVAGPLHWFDRVHPDDLAGLKDMLIEHLSGNARHFVHEYRVRGTGGDFLWVLSRGLVVRNLEGDARRIAGSMTDITERKLAEKLLAFGALHDELTGLANRTLFKDRLTVALKTMKRQSGSPFGVLFLDLDRFKRVNDTFGHSVGDRLLVEISRRLETFLRPGDTLARLGGDEFGILVADAPSVSDALHVAERVQERLRVPFTVDDRTLEVSASIGIALSATGYDEPEEILHDADVAMYRAKAAGRGQTQVFDPLMHRSAVALMRLESELRHAVVRGEFVMYYQPVVSFERGRVVGFEALVRWNHPERGLLHPGQFFAIAEESGLANAIGWWAMEDACRQLVEWHRRFLENPTLWVSVNISDRLFMQADMVSRAKAILADTGLDPTTLRLEFREEVVVRHGEQAIAKLEELRQAGIRLAVDDFGSGLSHLSFLQSFRYDTLKIDPSYISALGADAPTMIESILTMADGFGIGVIAEGVETADQADHLRRLRCPEGQGFWFARPVIPSDAEHLITTTPEWWGIGSQAH